MKVAWLSCTLQTTGLLQTGCAGSTGSAVMACKVLCHVRPVVSQQPAGGNKTKLSNREAPLLWHEQRLGKHRERWLPATCSKKSDQWSVSSLQPATTKVCMREAPHWSGIKTDWHAHSSNCNAVNSTGMVQTSGVCVCFRGESGRVNCCEHHWSGTHLTHSGHKGHGLHLGAVAKG